MLNIFICEDNDTQRRAIVQTIQNTVLIEELDKIGRASCRERV